MTLTPKRILATSAAAIILSGCGSGDIAIDPSTNVTNPPSNSTGGGDDNEANPCASYQKGGQTLQGSYDGTNCTYSSTFADSGNEVTVDLNIPALPDDGAHIFQGSLFIGKAYNSNAELDAAGIHEGGDGPTLTVEAGATLAFASEKQFLTINRGSQILAVGTADAPITFTSLSDVEGSVGPQDVQQWGGIVIDGFGVTNECAYTGSVAGGDLALDGECHVDSEGSAGLDENYHGGVNDDDSSGRLEYVVVKHTGAQVANGDELNGITFAAVGRNTVVQNLEVYSVYDDGIEFFGGAVNVGNYLAMYVKDDSIDIDSGYSGTITNALAIQSADGNHCIESDGIAGYEDLDDPAVDVDPAIEAVIDQGINSRPTINHLTCIINQNKDNTHDPGAGWLFREGIFPTINDSIVIASYGADDTSSATDNYCLKIDNRSQQAALDGSVVLNHVIFSCAERTAGQTFADGTTTEESFATGTGTVQFATIPNGTAVNPTAAAGTDLQLLEGTPPVYSIAWASSMVDGVAPTAGTEPADGYLGALSTGATDWTAGWTYGLHPDNRGEAPWFE